MLLFASVGILFFAFWFLKNIVFKILYTVAPILLIIALILNYRVVLGYGKWLLDTFRNNFLYGILACVFTFLCYPFVAAFLAIRAYQLRGKSLSKKNEIGEYIKYKDVEDDFLDITEEKKEQEEIKKRFEGLF